jgi:TonB family protein
MPGLKSHIQNLTAICRAPVSHTPSLANFLLGRDIPKLSVTLITPKPTAKPLARKPYIAAFPVMDGADYGKATEHAGDRVELIGCVVEVTTASTRYGKPYVFIKFGPGRNGITKINIWSEGLTNFSPRPSKDLIGKWVSVTGLLEPYSHKRSAYINIGITITNPSELKVIDDAEARYRLGAQLQPVSNLESSSNAVLDLRSNAEVLRRISRGSSTTSSSGAVRPLSQATGTANQTILATIRGGITTSPAQTCQVPPTAAPYSSTPRGSTTSPSAQTRQAPSIGVPPSGTTHQYLKWNIGWWIVGATVLINCLNWLYEPKQPPPVTPRPESVPRITQKEAPTLLAPGDSRHQEQGQEVQKTKPLKRKQHSNEMPPDEHTKGLNEERQHDIGQPVDESRETVDEVENSIKSEPEDEEESSPHTTEPFQDSSLHQPSIDDMSEQHKLETDRSSTVDIDFPSLKSTNPYFALIRRRISSRWFSPIVEEGDKKLRTIISFRIEGSGKISGISVERSSGNDYFDLAAKRAVFSSSPLSALPSDISAPYVNAHFRFSSSPDTVER